LKLELRDLGGWGNMATIKDFAGSP